MYLPLLVWVVLVRECLGHSSARYQGEQGKTYNPTMWFQQLDLQSTNECANICTYHGTMHSLYQFMFMFVFKTLHFMSF